MLIKWFFNDFGHHERSCSIASPQCPSPCPVYFPLAPLPWGPARGKHGDERVAEQKGGKKEKKKITICLSPLRPGGPYQRHRALLLRRGKHGVGRIDIVENRFVGMKSRGEWSLTPSAIPAIKAAKKKEKMLVGRHRCSASLGCSGAGLTGSPHLLYLLQDLEVMRISYCFFMKAAVPSLPVPSFVPALGSQCHQRPQGWGWNLAQGENRPTWGLVGSHGRVLLRGCVTQGQSVGGKHKSPSFLEADPLIYFCLLGAVAEYQSPLGISSIGNLRRQRAAPGRAE